MEQHITDAQWEYFDEYGYVRIGQAATTGCCIVLRQTHRCQFKEINLFLDVFSPVGTICL